MVSAAWLVPGCTDGGQYAQVLDRAERQNQNWDSITGIDSILMAVKYVDRHGSNNNKVRAYYLLGCAYRDAGEAPNALEAFHEAADRADTMSVDCDYGLLVKIHSQSSELFRYQQLPYEMLEELEAQRRCAIKAGDTKASINAIERSAEAYQLLNMSDSIISFRMRASTMYEQCGFTEEAAQTLSPCIEPLVNRGDTAEGRRCIERYETSKEFFKDGEILPRKLVYYYNKGKYYLATNQTDSAEVCFRKLIKPGLSPQKLEAGYRGMFLLYRQKNKLDSVAKYADLLFLEAIPVVEAVNKENIQQMQRLYNYSRFQAKERLATEKSEQQKSMIIILVSVSVILQMTIIGIYKHLQWKRKRQQLEYEKLLYEYEKEKAELAKVQAELKLAKNSQRTVPSEFREMENQIRLHQHRIEELERNLRVVIGEALHPASPHFPLTGSEEEGKQWFDYLVSKGFIAKDTELACWLYVMGFSSQQPLQLKPIAWLKTVETAQMMIRKVHANLLNTKQLTVAKMYELASQCFTKQGEPLRLSKPKKEYSQDADDIEEFLPTVSDL